MDPFTGSSGSRGRGTRRVRGRSVRERGGHGMFGDGYWANRPPLPIFTDEQGFPLPIAYQIPLAAAWAEVHAREGGIAPSHVRVHHQTPQESSGDFVPPELAEECDFCRETGHTMDVCLHKAEHDGKIAISTAGEQPPPPADPVGSVSPTYTPATDSSDYSLGSPEYTPSTPLYGHETSYGEPLPFTPKRRFRRTGNRREYLRKYSSRP